MPPVIGTTGGWARPGTQAPSGGWATGALHAVRRAVSTLVLRSAPVSPAPNLSKEFQHSPEWRKFLCF